MAGFSRYKPVTGFQVRILTRIAILDSAGDMAHLAPFLIRTDMADGLTDEDADRCIQLLMGEQDAGV